jgi:hypothetical protein
MWTVPTSSEKVAHPNAAAHPAPDLHAVMLERQKEILDAAMRYDEEQRAAFARFLHDRVSQALVAVELGLHLFARNADQTSDVSVRSLTELLREVGREVHDAALGLRPCTSGEFTFAESLRRLAGDWTAVSSIPIEVSIAGESMPETAGRVMYRTLQILLATFVQPNTAKRVSVRVSATVQHISLAFVIESLAPDTHAADFPDSALQSLLNLARMIAGRIEWTFAPDGIATVYFSAPTADHPFLDPTTLAKPINLMPETL